jgi:hypothetical protein
LAQSTFVQDALPIVIVAVVIVAAVVAVATLLSSGGAYDRIGRGELTFDREVSAAAEADSLRDAEIRQLLEARNARRIAHGAEPIDVESELAALTRPPADDSLRAEIRSLVEARNARRVARGRPPLDVEAEVERRLSELDG